MTKDEADAIAERVVSAEYDNDKMLGWCYWPERPDENNFVGLITLHSYMGHGMGCGCPVVIPLADLSEEEVMDKVAGVIALIRREARASFGKGMEYAQ